MVEDRRLVAEEGQQAAAPVAGVLHRERCDCVQVLTGFQLATEGNRNAVAYQTGCFAGSLWCDEVQRSQLVVGSPPPMVRDLLEPLVELRSGRLSGPHRGGNVKGHEEKQASSFHEQLLYAARHALC